MNIRSRYLVGIIIIVVILLATLGILLVLSRNDETQFPVRDLNQWAVSDSSPYLITINGAIFENISLVEYIFQGEENWNLYTYVLKNFVHSVNETISIDSTQMSAYTESIKQTIIKTKEHQSKISFSEFKDFKIATNMVYPSFESRFFDMNSVFIQIHIYEMGLFIGIANAYYLDERGLFEKRSQRVPIDNEWLSQVHSGTYHVGIDIGTYYLYYIKFDNLSDIYELPYFNYMENAMLIK